MKGGSSMKWIFEPKKIIVGFGLFLLFLLLPIFSHAQDAYYLQSVVDTSTYTYQGNVLPDHTGPSTAHLEYQVGDFTAFNANPEQPLPAYSGMTSFVQTLSGSSGNGGRYSTSQYTQDQQSYNTDLPFTFAPYEVDNWLGGSKNTATAADANRAYLIQSTLVPGLDNAIQVLNNGQNPTNVEQLAKLSSSLSSAIAHGGGLVGNTGFTVHLGVAPQGTPALDKSTGIFSNDYLELSNGNQDYYFVYRIIKGYNQPSYTADGSTWNSSVYPADASLASNYKGDTTYITWNMLMDQAMYNYGMGTTASDASSIVKPDPLTSALVTMLSGLFNSLENLLGLYNISDLIYNTGIRGSEAWVYGIMPQTWANTALLYQWVFQLFAWSLIVLAVVKALVKRNISTINPAMRVSLIEEIQNLMISALLLGSILPVLNLAMMFNEKIVAVFASMTPNAASFGEINNYSSVLGAVILQFFYFIIDIYLNFVYIMRAITVTLLIATAPLFVVTLAFGGKWSQLFYTWIRELLGNIFIQSVQAFIFSIFLSLVVSSRGIVEAVVAFSLIPMTNFFRSLLLGSGGDITHSLGMNALTAGASMAGGAIGGMMGAGSAKGGKTGSNSSSSSSNSGGNSAPNTSKGNADSFGNVSGKSDKIRNNQQVNEPSALSQIEMSRQALDNKETPIHVADDPSNARYGEYKDQELGNNNTSIGRALQSMNENVVNPTKNALNHPVTRMGIGGLKALGGATKVVAGTGAALALGGVSPNLAGKATKFASEGFGHIKSGVRDVASGSAHGVGLAKDSVLGKGRDGYATTMANGDIQVHRNSESLAAEGITRMDSDSAGNAVVDYNMDTLKKTSPSDYHNVMDYMDAFKSGNKEKIDYYRQQGIERVSRREGSKDIVVAYNQIGKSKLGIKDVKAVGDNRYVETKNSHDPIQTRKSVNVTPMPKPAPPPPTPSPILGANGKSINSPTINSTPKRGSGPQFDARGKPIDANGNPIDPKNKK